MKVGFIGIIIEKDRAVAEKVNALLSLYGQYICGRMGVPDTKSGVFVISVVIKATNEVISALTGKLGRLDNVKVRSAVAECDVI